MRAPGENPHPNPSPVGEGERASALALRRILAFAAFDLGDERGDRSADCLRVILLQEVEARPRA
jgi:hypothetical protein